VSELGLSVIVALRKAIPNSTSLIFPITLPLARWGPPMGERKHFWRKKQFYQHYMREEKVNSQKGYKSFLKHKKVV
jgi:hypothetical protein